MSHSKREDRKNKWLRLAVGATLLAGVSGAVLPGMASAAEANVSGGMSTEETGFYKQLGEKVCIPHDGWEEKWYFTYGEDSSGNTVTFNNFTPDGYDFRFGGGFGNGAAVTNNKVLITNSTLRGVVVGGYTAANDEVSGNVITLGEGTKVADGASLQVFGGYAATTADTIANNTVNILTSITLDALKGGENKDYSAGQNGNTLNIVAKNVKTNWFGSFENVNFFLPSDIAAGDTMLTVENGGDATNLNGVKVGVAAQSGVGLQKGESVRLIVNKTGLDNAPTEFTAIENKNIQMVVPNSLMTDKEYTFDLEQEKNGDKVTSLNAKVKDITVKAAGDDKKSADQPATNTSGTGKTVDTPAADKAETKKSAAEKTNTENKSTEKQNTEPTSTEKSNTEKADTGKTGTDKQATDPSVVQPSSDNKAAASVDDLKKELTNVGISAEHIHVYNGNVAGALDPNQRDNVSAEGIVLTDGTIDGDVYAGHSTGDHGKAEKNAVIMTGGTVNGTLYGGHSDNGESTGNFVEFDGGKVNSIVGGGSDVGDNNTVTVNDGEVVDNVYGGKAATSASGNTVNVNGGTIGNSIYGGYSEEGAANNNTVNVNGKAKLTGGWAKIIGGFSAKKDAEVSNNTVNLIEVDGMNLGNLQGGSVVYMVDGAERYDGATNVSSNTMNFVASKNISTHYFDGFSTVNFYLPKDIANGDTILTVSDGSVNLDGVNVGVAAPYGLDNLKEKESVNLIKNEGKLSGTPTQVEASTDTTKVSFLTPANLVTDKKYDFSLTTTADALTATLDSVTTTGAGGSSEVPDTPEKIQKSQELKSLVETQAAATTILNGGADMLAGAGFEQAKAAADRANSGGKFAPFAAMGASKLRAESGSYVDTKGYGVNVGFAREVKKGNKNYLFGPVVEYGKGKYDSYQDTGIKASGDSSFWGVGVMGRQTNSRGVYYEGSLRAGKVKADYSGNLYGGHVDYDNDSKYWAGHLGWGQVAKLKGGNSLDTYVKYFYSHQDGDKVKLNINRGGAAITDEITFENVESQRLRLGTRLTHQVNENNNLYAGIAYQCETKGEARATYQNSDTAAPSVKGSSVLFELGWQVKPGKSPVSLDLGVNGWAGKQRGVSGKLGFKYNF